MLTLVAPEQRVPEVHPLRRIKELADSALQALSSTFDAMYAEEAKLNYRGNVLMGNRNGLIVDHRVEQASGFAERDAALAMLDDSLPDQVGVTLGADAGYDIAGFVASCRERGITPHVAQTTDTRRRSAVDGRTVRHPGYEVSQRLRKRVEEIFGWSKTVGFARPRPPPSPDLSPRCAGGEESKAEATTPARAPSSTAC